MSLDPVKWKKDYSTGNESVDFQHQYFASLINRISENLLETNDMEYRRRLIDELMKYGQFHFTSEENIATSLGLKAVNKHHQRHVELLEEIRRYSEDLFDGKCSTNDFVEFLFHWFIGHTVYEDTSFFSGKTY